MPQLTTQKTLQLATEQKAERIDPSVELTKIKTSTVLAREPSYSKRQIRDQRRTATAAEAIEDFDQATEIIGFTKGQFSIIDLLKATLAKTGPASLVISTWTAASADITTTLNLIESDQITGARWLVDLSLQRRQPELTHRIREVFGADAIRVGKNHAKFYLIGNNDWKVVIRTSMNLNFNPRFEDYHLANDPELFEFFNGIIEEIWTKQNRDTAFRTPYAIEQQWDADN